MKKPTKILLGVTTAAALGVVGLGVALPAQASATHPATVHSTGIDTGSDGETADDTTGATDAETADGATDPVDGNGVEDGTKDGETADD